MRRLAQCSRVAFPPREIVNMLDAILQRLSFGTSILIVFATFTAWYLARRIRESRKIAALGGRAPRVSIYLPLGETDSRCSSCRGD